ncbi:hypothetical protein WJX72_001565 [[Myrmecia] bisecta]|uniref:Uncharacterized protein n=1 Tax=[Myrmecia] bisecta TaxID=41462 RepID=A0AAW1R5K6_9CHLO
MALIEKLVLAKSRVDRLEDVKNLNLWGQDLEDMGLLSSLPNVEVLSLSVNKISSLRDFAGCRKLQEVYLRKNEIRDLAEIEHLAELPDLKVLWMADNPCADTPGYRSQVIHTLTALTKLDNEDITPEERGQASPPGQSVANAASTLTPLPGAQHLACAANASSTGRGAAGPGEPLASRASTGKRSAADLQRPGASPNVLYAVMALLADLDAESLRIVKAEVEQRLQAAVGTHSSRQKVLRSGPAANVLELKQDAPRHDSIVTIHAEEGNLLLPPYEVPPFQNNFLITWTDSYTLYVNGQAFMTLDKHKQQSISALAAAASGVL